MASHASFRVRDADVSFREIDGEIIVLDERTWRYLHLNGSGAVLWARLMEGGDAESLAAALITEYGIDQELADRDAAAFLADLLERELIVEG
ncbi:MAG: PqqD family protein [Solirubrobacteraceae bacterium]|nr:PqqD family protein [Solirubrobacteraceae bacterium]